MSEAPKRPFALRDREDEVLENLKLDLAEDAPKAYMKVCNSTDEPLAYKVKTTEPRRYIVRPNQGALPPRGEELVEISLLKREKSELLKAAYDRSGGLSPEQLDRFLVQAVSLDGPSLQELLSLPAAARSDRLTAQWAAFGAEPLRKQVKKQKLDMHFLFASEGGETHPSRVAERVREQAAGGAAPAEGADMFEEMRRLRRQYDELVDFSVRLTAEREVLQKHLESTKANWMREMRSRVALENQLGVGGRSASGEEGALGDADLPPPPVAAGFSWVQFAVIAVVCFFVGRLI